MHRQKIGLVESEQKCVFVNVQQCLSAVTSNGIFASDVCARIFPSFGSVSGMSEDSINRAANRTAMASCVDDKMNGSHFHARIFSRAVFAIACCGAFFSEEKNASSAMTVGGTSSE